MKNIYITWHYTTHGVAYLKHILSKFYLLDGLSDNLYYSQLNQIELNQVFDQSKEKSFLFDEVIYLTTAQSSFDKLSTRRFSYKDTILKDDFVKENGLVLVFKAIITNNDVCYHLEKELEYVKDKFPDKIPSFKEAIWRNIQHYPIEEQIHWLTQYSNFKNVYSKQFKVVELAIDDLRNEKQIAIEVEKWMSKYFSGQKKAQPIINVSLGSNETQVVWHILAEAGQLPQNTRFIKTYDDKSSREHSRFKNFSIQEIPTNLISEIGAGFKIYTNTQSPNRKLTNKKMAVCLKSGFSILLIGERGTGKSRIAKEAEDKFDSKIPFIEANCASFEEDSKAESELFGHEKGAFTGANQIKKGLLEEANGGVLFLDEIHHLSKLVQAKLMTALQTNKNNQMSFMRMGGTNKVTVKCHLIFATNRSILELRDKDNLLPDFYDRIVQHVIEIPPLRDTAEDREKDWETIWEGLKFYGKPDVPKDKGLIDWLKQLPLYGNFRDLQKIAMYYNIFNQFDDETKKMLSEKTAFQYAKQEFEKYYSPVVQSENEKFNFNINQTSKEMIADYLFELQAWAVEKFKGRKKAIEHFKQRGDTIVEKTFSNWKNKESIKDKS